ncbi:MAG: hypothetical protein JXA92_11555 [candidate division Zixibacteria bacterium]|nr:hypothetical protein [candidate division Zixibacteria bacterium]
MHAKKFMLLMILLAFVITCFIAAPVFSGNGSSDGYPWDADDTGTHDDPNDDKPDTTTSSQVIMSSSFVVNPDSPDLIDGIASQILFFIMNSVYYYQPDTYYIMSEAEGSNNEQAAAVKSTAK